MNTGLNKNELNKISIILASNSLVQQAILYGSRAMGNYKPHSDIDITLIGDKLKLSDLYLIENQIDDLLLPYTIDISLLNYIKNENLLEHISRVGIPFYTARESFSEI